MLKVYEHGDAYVEDEGTGCSATVAQYKDNPIRCIWSLYCPPDKRQFGGATRVMQEITEFLDAQKASCRLQAQPFIRNAAGTFQPPNYIPAGLELDKLIRFYESFGFKVIHRGSDGTGYAIMYRMQPGELAPYYQYGETHEVVTHARNAVRERSNVLRRWDYSQAVKGGIVFA